MRSGNDVLEQALHLLGFLDDRDSDPTSPALYRRGLAAVNQIYADLWAIGHGNGVVADQPCFPLTALSEPLNLPDRTVADILPYGVAMLMAQAEGDGEAQELYAALYSQKRSAAVHPPLRRQNVLFHGEGV